MTTTTIPAPVGAKNTRAEFHAPRSVPPLSTAVVLAHVLTWAVLAALFTSLIVRYSLTRGKLIVPATYDDVTYLRDGLDKLDGLYRAGISGVISRSLLRPPHSPLSTLIAFVGYAIFGVNDWAPYAANGLIIVCLLAFTDFLTRGMRPLHKLALFVFVLTIPIAGQTIYEFRSDMAVGLLSAITIVLLLDQPLVTSRSRRLIGIGLIIAGTLAAKTSVFPVTLALAGMALLAASIRDRIVLGRRASLAALAKSWAKIILPALLVPLPYYVRNRREIYAYITVNALGTNSGIWKLHADLTTHLLYYATGSGGNIMLGTHFMLLVTILVIGLIGIAVAAGRAGITRSGIARAVCLAVMLAVAYAGPTVNQIKDQFLATCFDFLLIFAVVLILKELCTVTRNPARASVNVGLTLLAVVGVWQAKFPVYWGEVTRPDVVMRNGYINGLYREIRARGQGRPVKVLVGVTGSFANADTFGYLADKDGLTTPDKDGIARLTFESDFTNPDIERFRKLLDFEQFVITGDVGNPEDNPYTPYTLMLDKTLPMLRARPDYECVLTCPSAAGKNYYLFQRRPKSS